MNMSRVQENAQGMKQEEYANRGPKRDPMTKRPKAINRDDEQSKRAPNISYCRIVPLPAFVNTREPDHNRKNGDKQ